MTDIDQLQQQVTASGLPIRIAYDDERAAFVVTWTTGREAIAGPFAIVQAYLRGLHDGGHWHQWVPSP